MNIFGMFVAVAGVLVGVAVLIVIAGAATGRAQRWGLIGAVLLLIGSIAGAVLSLGAAALFQRFDLPATAYTVLNAPVVLLRTAGLIVIGVAIATHARDTQPQINR